MSVRNGVYCLFKFFTKERKLLYACTGPNIYQLQNREWWPFVEFIKVEHFTNAVDLSNAKYTALDPQNPKLSDLSETKMRDINYLNTYGKTSAEVYDMYPGGTSDGE